MATRSDTFSPSDDYVVARGKLTCAGKDYVRGEPFDKSSVNVRRLRQMFELRYITRAVQAEPLPTDVKPVPAPEPEPDETPEPEADEEETKTDDADF